MKLKKGILSLLVTSVVIFNSILSVPAATNVSNINATAEKTIIVGDTVIDNPLIRASHYVIENETIYTSDKSWNQPSGYSSYRIHATNTRNEVMKMTIKYGKNSHTYNIPANGSNTITVNNAQDVKHTISFTTNSGSVSGKVSVRISDTSL